MRPPWRFETKRRRVSGKTQRIALDNYLLTIGSAFFVLLGPRSKSDLVLGGQRSNFREISNFSTLR